jgi:hypothetical protein
MVALTRQHAFGSWLVAGFMLVGLLSLIWR